MTLSRTANIVLALLNLHRSTAYDLRLTLRRRMDLIWNESPGQLYPAVKQLLSLGLISEDRVPAPRERVTLSITDDGRLAAEHWLTTAPSADTPRDELVARVALLQRTPSAHLLHHLDTELQRTSARADAERTLNPPADRHMLNVPSIAGERLARRWVILFNEARATWCREALVHLRELAHPELNPLLSRPPSSLQ